MFSLPRRHLLVITLALLTGGATQAVSPQVPHAQLPAIATLTAGTGWRSVAPNPVGAQGVFDGRHILNWRGMVWAQWRLQDRTGADALLYVGVATALQRMVRWSGELGYVGEGYLVLHHNKEHLQLSNGTMAPISVVVAQHLTDRRLVAYAVVGPRGVAASTTDDLLRNAWDMLVGRDGPYYLVRVSVPWSINSDDTHASATHLLRAAIMAAQTDTHGR